VKEETVDDACAATELLRRHPRIDPARVFVLGHSLGGMLVPRIAAREPALAGGVVMAGTARPFEDVILEQLRFLSSLTGGEGGGMDLAALERQVARVKSPDLAATTPLTELPLGVPGAYWLDLRGYDPPRMAKDLRLPLLVLQGGRDYQVTQADFKRWKDALSRKPGVAFRFYQNLNHLFAPGEGKPTPQDYERPGHVAQAVIDDVARWVKSIGAGSQDEKPRSPSREAGGGK